MSKETIDYLAEEILDHLEQDIMNPPVWIVVAFDEPRKQIFLQNHDTQEGFRITIETA